MPSTATAIEVTAVTATNAAVAAAPTVESISLALAFGIAACGLGQFLAGALGVPSINLAAMAVVASLFASVGSSLTATSGAAAATPFKGDNPCSNMCLWLSSLRLANVINIFPHIHIALKTTVTL